MQCRRVVQPAIIFWLERLAHIHATYIHVTVCPSVVSYFVIHTYTYIYMIHIILHIHTSYIHAYIHT
jgi:hypothetical protein